MGPLPIMGIVCPELDAAQHHRSNTIQMCAWATSQRWMSGFAGRKESGKEHILHLTTKSEIEPASLLGIYVYISSLRKFHLNLLVLLLSLLLLIRFQLSLPPHLCIYPVFHVSRLKQVSRGPLITELPQQPLSAPLEIGGAPTYRVHHLLYSRRRGGGHQYLVNCENDSPEENIWVLDQAILSQALVKEYHQSCLDHPGSRPRSQANVHSQSSTDYSSGSHSPSVSATLKWISFSLRCSH